MRKVFAVIALVTVLVPVALADSLNIRTIGMHNTPQTARGFSIAGSYVYVTVGDSGMQVVNISNLASPAKTGSCPATGSFVDVAVSGSCAFVTDYWFGFRAINISNPAAPMEIGSCVIPGNASALAISGNYAYVAAEDSGLQIVDISDSAHPAVASCLHTPSRAYDVALSGVYPYAYVADRDSGVRVINISVPTTPGNVGSYDTPGYAHGVASVGNYIYVADGASGLRVLDLSGGLHEVGSYIGSMENAWDVAVSGNYAYVTDFYNSSANGGGLQVIDISNPGSPALSGYYYLQDNAVLNVKATGGYVYVSASDGLHIFQSPIPLVMELNSSQCDFGTVAVGDSVSSSELFLKNKGCIPLTIDSLKLSTGEFRVGPIADSTIAPGDSLQLLLWFRPGTVGKFSDNLYIHAAEADNSPVTAELTGIGEPRLVVIDVPCGSVPLFEGDVDPTEWADAYCDTFRVLNKSKAFIPDSFWVKYNQDTLYLALKTPSYEDAGIDFHHLLFDTLMNRADVLENDDIRLSVFDSGEPVEFYGDKNWALTPVWLWRSDYSTKTDLVTEFVVPLDKIGIAPGKADSVGFAVFADGPGHFGRWPSFADSIQPITWGILTSKDDWTGVAMDPENEFKCKIPLSLNVYPNPVGNHAKFSYRLSEPSQVKLNVYNIAGQLVQSLDRGLQASGSYVINWKVKGVPNGTYFCRLQAGPRQIIKRILIVR